MNTNGHYDVRRDSGHDAGITALTCKHCDFRVSPVSLHQGRDRSGQPRYNRARAKMVKHLHDQHRAELASSKGQTV